MVEAKQVKKSAVVAPQVPNLDDHSLYINRELSALEFTHRVLSQATETRHPLLERVKFLAMSSQNLDEFFMVRVADLQDEIEGGLVQLSADGMTPGRLMAAIRRRVTALLVDKSRIYQEHLLPALREKGITIVDLQDLSTSQKAALRTYFDKEVFPVLTPLAVDPGHPFPHISNQSVNLAVELKGDGTETRFARVKIPDVIDRLIHVETIVDPHANGKRAKQTFVWLEQLVAHNLGSLFPGVPVLNCYTFYVVRDADIEIRQEEGADLRVSVERGLRQRRFGEAVRLTVDARTPEHIRTLLAQRLGLGAPDVYAVEHPVGLGSLMQLASIDRPDLKYPPLVPRIPASLAAGEPVVDMVDHDDILVYHPYDSFAPVVDLLRESARDDSVLAIKQTLYRVGTDAPVVRALLDAVNHGKQVAVMVELKARFDEASNIEWARELERAGVHVSYGFVGLKTHAKVMLIVRKGPDGIRRDVHVSTGNYNVNTARTYSDLGLFTADPDFGADATDLFNYLTGYSEQRSYRRFLVAPVNLRQGLLERIEREIRQHRDGGKGHLIFKVNSLVDTEFVQALYRASQAGVKVDLLVRGMCCLRPGIPGVSDTIQVTSLVGRFLEHARIYYFANGGDSEIYVGSADLMPRNLDHRVEVLFPVLKPELRDRIVRHILDVDLEDNVNAWRELPDGTYERSHPSSAKKRFDSQDWSIDHAL